MARSLRDELLKAGLVTSEQAARAERGTRQRSKPAATKTKGKSRGGSRSRPARPASRHRYRDPPAPARPAPVPAESSSIDPEERVRRLNLEIRRILDAEAEKAEPEGDAPFHFARGERLKRLYVSEDQRRRLSAGELAIVGFRGRHHLVPRPAGERVRELRPEVFVFIATDGTEADAVAEGYEEYEVPDELIW